MTAALLTVLVLGVVVIAITVDLGALVTVINSALKQNVESE